MASGAMVEIPTSTPSFISDEQPAPSRKAMFFAFIASEIAWRAVSALLQSNASGSAAPLRKNMNVRPTNSSAMPPPAPALSWRQISG
ncbi:hypothetical protein D3C87_1683480 [compost metagenome]